LAGIPKKAGIPKLSKLDKNASSPPPTIPGSAIGITIFRKIVEFDAPPTFAASCSSLGIFRKIDTLNK
jgi:hypothetical protein